jgi:hypothetical protein
MTTIVERSASILKKCQYRWKLLSKLQVEVGEHRVYSECFVVASDFATKGNGTIDIEIARYALKARMLMLTV